MNIFELLVTGIGLDTGIPVVQALGLEMQCKFLVYYHF